MNHSVYFSIHAGPLHYGPKITIYTIEYCVRYIIEEKRTVCGGGVANKWVDRDEGDMVSLKKIYLSFQIPNINPSTQSVYDIIILCTYINILLCKILSIACIILKYDSAVGPLNVSFYMVALAPTLHPSSQILYYIRFTGWRTRV